MSAAGKRSRKKTVAPAKGFATDPPPPPPTPLRAGPIPLYFVNAWVDYGIIGGVSILIFILLSQLHTERTVAIWSTAAALTWVINWPHFSATSYRLYHSRENLSQYPVTALAVPVLVGMGIIASFASPQTFAPLFVKFFLIWSPYHFSGQTVGITLIYARRAGVPISKLHRLALSGFVFGTFLTPTAQFEVTGRGEFYGISYPGFGLPEWVPMYLGWMMYLCGAAFLVLIVHWCVTNRRLLPPIVLLPPLTQYVWFVLGARVASFNEFVPFFHGLQYMLIAWSMQLKEKLDLSGAAPSKSFVLKESTRWGITNFIGGALLFFGIPHLLGMTSYGLPFATAVFISGVQIHHFFVDGVIWKIKNPKVASPLLVNLSDLMTPKVKAA